MRPSRRGGPLSGTAAGQTAAERARSLAARDGPVAVLPGRGDARVCPQLHHVADDGSTLLVVPAEDPLVSAAADAPRREVPAMLEITDTAPVALREPVRGLLWITGWVRALRPAAARGAAIRIAEGLPDPRLLDVGHGATVLRMLPASLVLAEAAAGTGGDTTSIDPTAFALARPDPFCREEDHWLRHLEECHQDAIDRLARHVPTALRGPGSRVRPLGVDRYGLRLRVEVDGATGAADHDVAVPFARPVSDAAALGTELRRLALGPA